MDVQFIVMVEPVIRIEFFHDQISTVGPYKRVVHPPVGEGEDIAEIAVLRVHSDVKQIGAIEVARQHRIVLAIRMEQTVGEIVDNKTVHILGN